MIYSILLYQVDSGRLIYEKRFEDESIMNVQMVSSFLITMKTFVSELIIERAKDLGNIELGGYLVSITGIPKMMIDLVIIVDKEDNKIVSKIIPKIEKFLLKYEDLFLSWNGDREIYRVLEGPLTTLVLDHIKDFRKSSTIKSEQTLEPEWAKSKHLTEEERNEIIQERDMLIYSMETTPILLKKVVMAEKVIELSNQLNDEDTALLFQNEVGRLKKEIEDIKLKLKYYLERTTSTLTESIEFLGNKPMHSGDFKNVYLNLYSFGSKLNLLKENGGVFYRELANKLIEKDSLSEDELTDIIRQILAMSQDIEDYLKE
jgi:hypothetical protein